MSCSCTGPRQQIEPRRVLGHRPLEQLEVEPRDILDDIDHRVVGDGVQKHVGVTQRQVEVDQGHGVGFVGRQDAAQVDGQAGRPHAAGGAGHGQHLAAARLARRPCRRAGCRSAPVRSTSSSMPTGCVRNSLAPARIALQDQLAVRAAADHQDAAFGRGFAQILRSACKRLVRIGVDADHADVRIRLADDVDEELVPRGLGFQPTHVHAQEHRLERLPGMRHSDRRWPDEERSSLLARLPANEAVKQTRSRTLDRSRRRLLQVRRSPPVQSSSAL